MALVRPVTVWGVKQFFDPSKVVSDASLTLSEGAIRGWDRRALYYFQQLKAVSEHYGFNMDTPFKELMTNNRR